MSTYDQNHYNIVISLQLIKINEKKRRKISIASKIVDTESQVIMSLHWQESVLIPLIGHIMVSTAKTSKSHQLEGPIDSTIIF